MNSEFYAANDFIGYVNLATFLGLVSRCLHPHYQGKSFGLESISPIHFRDGALVSGKPSSKYPELYGDSGTIGFALNGGCEKIGTNEILLHIGGGLLTGVITNCPAKGKLSKLTRI